MKILAFAATNSSKSINKALVTHAADVLATELISDAEVEILDLNEFEAPIFGIDVENESGIPEAAKRLYEKIGGADVLLVSYAEHNGSYTAYWKSLFDWMSRIDRKVYHDKPMVVFATSPGGRGGASVLKTVVDAAEHFGGNIKGSMSVPSFNDVFDVETGKLTDETLSAELRTVLGSLNG